MTATTPRPPAELLDEIREDLRHEGTPRCDRWFPEITEGAPVVHLDLTVGLAWWTVALPIVEKVRNGDRVLILESPDEAAVGRVGTVAVREGWPFVDLQDGTGRFPMLRSAALLPAA
jgi:hypothetical protein